MRLPPLAFALIVALPFAAACSGSEGGGAGGATASTGTTKPVVKAKDAGPHADDAGPDIESTSAGW